MKEGGSLNHSIRSALEMESLANDKVKGRNMVVRFESLDHCQCIRFNNDVANVRLLCSFSLLLLVVSGFAFKIHNPLRVTPLIVVPGNNLNHVVSHDHGERRVHRGRHIAASEVDGHQGLVADGEDAVQLVGGGFPEGGVNFLGEGLLGDLNDEVDDGDVGGGDSEGDAVELALEAGEDKRDGLGGSGIITKFLVEDLDERSKAVGGARGVADDGLIGAVSVGVDAHNVGGDVALSRGCDQNLLRSGLDMFSGAFSVHENTDYPPPREVERVAAGYDFDDLAVDGDGVVADGLDVGVEDAEGGVVFEKVRGLLDTSGVVDGNDVKGRILPSMPAPQEDVNAHNRGLEGNDGVQVVVGSPRERKRRRRAAKAGEL
nr:hypothetical protein A7M47_18000 [Ipomoea trifida]